MSSIGSIKLKLKVPRPEDTKDEQAESEERVQWNQSDTNLQLAIMQDEVKAALTDFGKWKTGTIPLWHQVRWIYEVGSEIIGFSLWLPTKGHLVDYLTNAGFQCTMLDDLDTLIELLLQRKDGMNNGAQH